MSTVIYIIGGVLLGIIGILSGVIAGKNSKISRLKDENEGLGKQNSIYEANREAMDETKRKMDEVSVAGDVGDAVDSWNDGVQKH